MHVNLREYFRMVRDHWVVVVLSTLIATALAGAITFTITPQYASTAQLFVSTREANTTQAYQGGLFSQQRIASYSELVGSRRVAEQVREAVETPLSVDKLREKVEASALPNTVLLDITITDSDPAVAQKLAQAYAEAVSKVIVELEAPAEGEAGPIRATIAEEAPLPSSPVSPTPTTNLAAGALVGLLAGLAYAIGRELLDTTLRSPEDVADVADVPVLCRVSVDGALSDRSLAVTPSSSSSVAETFKILRTNLQFVDVDAASKIYVVSSAVAEEGKTSIICNLSVALAQAGQRTILIDADLREPRVAEMFGVEGSVGLTTVLVGNASLADALQSEPSCGLDILASGPVPPNPAELLQSEAMSDLLSKLRTEYDIVLMDTPPLLPVADAAVLSSLADGVLLVLRHGRTTKAQLSMSIERVEAVGARTIGVAINMVPEQSATSYGYGS